MDPNGSMTRISNIPVTAEVPSMSLYKNTLLIEQFCNNYPSSSRCPDGSNLRPTSIDISGANKIADGKHFYDHRIIFRDRYGNAITN
jgi:hypothetical protein